jgi:uncharacterized repeat protein (TIGR03803 family)
MEKPVVSKGNCDLDAAHTDSQSRGKASLPEHRVLNSPLRWAVIMAFVMAFLLSGVASPRVHAQSFTNLHTFQGTDGSAPYYGRLVVDSKGNLFGTTELGGSGGLGTVFELVKVNNYSETVLHNFSSGDGDGYEPYGGLVMDSNGNLYGTTAYGGVGFGIVFELVAGNNYQETILYSFSYTDGAFPYADLIMDSSGNLFGTTLSGGASDLGAVFELNASNNYSTEKMLYSFSSSGDGYEPYGGLVMDSNGNLYGTTAYGGVGDGNVFELTASSGYATENSLYSFSYGDGAYPYGSLIIDSQGNLYGTTETGGTSGDGVVYELDASASPKYSTEKMLYSFSGTDGASPYAGLVMDSAGNLYGTTANGGSGYGVVFELTSSSNYATENVLHSFSGSDGAYSYAGLAIDQLGNFYGTTKGGSSYIPHGTVFSIATNSTIPFSAFFAKLSITAGPPPGFQLQAEFTLGTGSKGIDPTSDPLTLQVGTYSVTVPAGSFSAGPHGAYVFNGVVGGVTLAVRISPQGTNQYEIQVSASGVDLTGISLPTTVTLTIGNNTGSTQTTTGPLP